MGLFGTKNKTPPKDDVNQFLADFNEKNGDWESAFYFRNKAVIDLFDRQIADFRVAAQQAGNSEAALQNLKSAKAQYDSFRAWCSAQKGGLRYFDAHDRTGPYRVSQYERLEADIAKIEYSVRVLIPTIIEKAREGIKQADLIKSLDADEFEVKNAIRKLEEAGKITKEKVGKFVYIKAK